MNRPGGGRRAAASRVDIVILAAGGSERLGTPKQLVPYQGTTLIRHLAKVALDARAQGVTVVLGAHADLIEPELARMHVNIVRNAEWKTGMASSIRAAVQPLRDSTDAVLLMLSDQPLMTTPSLNSLIDRFREFTGQIIASEYQGTVGVPALFPKEFFPELLQLAGDEGAKSILLRHRRELLAVPFPDAAVDIDTLSDLKKLAGASRPPEA